MNQGGAGVGRTGRRARVLRAAMPAATLAALGLVLAVATSVTVLATPRAVTAAYSGDLTELGSRTAIELTVAPSTPTPTPSAPPTASASAPASATASPGGAASTTPASTPGPGRASSRGASSPGGSGPPLSLILVLALGVVLVAAGGVAAAIRHRRAAGPARP